MRQWPQQVPGLLGHWPGLCHSSWHRKDRWCMFPFGLLVPLGGYLPAYLLKFALASVPQHLEVPGLYQGGAYLPLAPFVYVPFLVSGF